MIRVAFVIGDYPPDQRLLREKVAKSYSTSELEVGILSVEPRPFGGLGPAEMELVAPYFHDAYIRAEQEGYDAVVPLGMLDLGVDGGRSQVDIPVIAPYEAALHIAAQLGDRIGIISYNRDGTTKAKTWARRYRMEPYIVGHRSGEFLLRNIADNKNRMIEKFIADARSLIENDDADVIIPHGITQCPVHMNPDWLGKQLGVPIVEGIGAPIRMAAMIAGLGLKHSRRRWPKSGDRPKPSESLKTSERRRD